MKIFIGSIILLSCISNLNAQVFKLENGLAFSKLQTKGVKGANIDLYPHKLTTYQISLGISICKQNISIYQVPLVTLKKEANIQTL